MTDVREIRARTGLTQGQLARLLRVPVWRVRDWEHGRRAPNDDQIAMMGRIEESLSADDGGHNEVPTEPVISDAEIDALFDE